MLIHFPIALWPAHAGLHLCTRILPAGTEVVAFWLLAVGTVLGWLAAFAGMSDVLRELKTGLPWPPSRVIAHAAVNGSVLTGFTALAAWETKTYPHLIIGWVALSIELALLVTMVAGNYLGGALVWGYHKRNV
ncbi:MAG: DUF2231 domain-containing protein [Nibricoccus sp.]